MTTRQVENIDNILVAHCYCKGMCTVTVFSRWIEEDDFSIIAECEGSNAREALAGALSTVITSRLPKWRVSEIVRLAADLIES